MTGFSFRKGGIALLCAFAAAYACAFAPMPQEAKCLGKTKGKSFSGGFVFLNGKYIPPPYRVERVGNVIFINRRQVTGQIIDWGEFVKTQAWACETDAETAAPAERKKPQTESRKTPRPVKETPRDVMNEEESAIDALFDDDVEDESSSAKTVPVKEPETEPEPAAADNEDDPPPPKPVKNRKFVMNARAKKLVDHIRDVRTNIDKLLRMGGFICFGDGYSRIEGDRAVAKLLVRELPVAQKASANARELEARLRMAGLEFVSYELCNDFYKNRFDYLRLQKLNEDIELGLEL